MDEIYHYIKETQDKHKHIDNAYMIHAYFPSPSYNLYLSPDTLKQERFHYIVFSKLKTPNISKTEPRSQILIQKIPPVYPLQDLT